MQYSKFAASKQQLHLSCILDFEQKTGYMEIQEVYKIDEDSETISTGTYGHWDSMKALKIYEPSILKRRSNFYGHEFK